MYRIIAVSLLALGLVACEDASFTRSTAPGRDLAESEGRGVMQRYVAVGTSISMGWQSDGLVEDEQRNAWTAQLARAAGRELTQPLVADPGCRSPMIAPLSSGKRRSGEAVQAANLSCAPILTGIELPTRSVAIAAATTQNALQSTPESITDPFYSQLYRHVLPAGTTQVSSAVALNPKLVSIELGANEVINARSGIALPGVTIVPYAQWAPLYDEVVRQLAAVSPRGVLVGLINDVGTFPSFRRGSEIWADRAAFLAAFNVAIDANCDASTSLLFVTVRVPTAVVTGLTRKAQGLGPAPFSCADGGVGVQDFVLTPAEAGVVNGVMAQMNAHIKQVASQYGYAYFELEALFGRSDVKGTFSVVQMMTSAHPYGGYTSLDGIHPNAAGHLVLATAAADAINARYGLGIPLPSPFIALP